MRVVFKLDWKGLVKQTKPGCSGATLRERERSELKDGVWHFSLAFHLETDRMNKEQDLQWSGTAGCWISCPALDTTGNAILSLSLTHTDSHPAAIIAMETQPSASVPTETLNTNMAHRHAHSCRCRHRQKKQGAITKQINRGQIKKLCADYKKKQEEIESDRVGAGRSISPWCQRQPVFSAANQSALLLSAGRAQLTESCQTVGHSQRGSARHEPRERETCFTYAG